LTVSALPDEDHPAALLSRAPKEDDEKNLGLESWESETNSLVGAMLNANDALVSRRGDGPFDAGLMERESEGGRKEKITCRCYTGSKEGLALSSVASRHTNFWMLGEKRTCGGGEGKKLNSRGGPERSNLSGSEDHSPSGMNGPK